MHALYQFLSGPMVWIAFIVFIGGSLYRLVAMIRLVNQKEPFIYRYMSWKYSFRSIGHWLIPFATTNWQRQPILTIVTFAFHLCLLITPIFLLAHVVLWEEAWSWGWWTLPDGLADIMTVVVIAGCIYFLVRRLKVPEVRFLTSASDFIILAIVAAPFVTGFIAHHQWFDYRFFCLAAYSNR